MAAKSGEQGGGDGAEAAAAATTAATTAGYVSGARAGGESPAQAAGAKGGGGGALGDARLLLLGIWLGAAVFFSFAVAPSAFAVLPARELAGAIVTRTIGIVNVGGFILALLLLLTTAFARRSGEKKTTTKRAWIVEITALVALALATGIGHWFIGARMAALRVAFGRPVDEVAANDPLRIAFNSLHGYSVAAMTTAMLAAVVAFILIARRNRND